MNAQQLKNAILQEAIEGRLVPQDPNDEPASVLLARIRQEKEQLVKAGKLKKKDLVVNPISEDEIPFEIPESWEWVRFFSVYNLETNLVPPQQYLSYNHVAPDNIEKGTGRLLHCNTVKEDKVKSNNHLFYEGQIVYSKIRPLLRKAIIAPFDGLCSADMYPLSTEMYSKYALLYLLSDTFNKQVSAICSSRVKMPKINQNELSTILVPLPPLAEQQRIVAKIEELLPKVEEYGKAQDALNKLNEELPERLKKSILQEAIEGRLVPQDPNDEPASVLLDKIRKEKAKLVKEGKLKKKYLEEIPISEDEKPFDIPESWEWCRISTAGDVITGGTPSKTESKYYGNDYPFYKPADLEQGINTINSVDSLSVEGYNHSRKLPKDSILVTCIGSIGKTGLIRKEGACNQQINAIIPNKRLFEPEYLYYYILSTTFQEAMLDKSSSTTLSILNKNKFSQLLLALPPLAEQKRIVEKLEQLLHEIDKLKV